MSPLPYDEQVTVRQPSHQSHLRHKHYYVVLSTPIHFPKAHPSSVFKNRKVAYVTSLKCRESWKRSSASMTHGVICNTSVIISNTADRPFCLHEMWFYSISIVHDQHPIFCARKHCTLCRYFNIVTMLCWNKFSLVVPSDVLSILASVSAQICENVHKKIT